MKSLDIRQALGNELDITVPSVTQQYGLGYIMNVLDSDTKMLKTFMYVKDSGSGMTINVPYTIDYTGTAGGEVTAKTPVALAGCKIGVPQVAFTASYYGFVQIGGDCKIACAASTTILHALLISAAAPTVATDEGQATVSVNTFAIAKATSTPAATLACVLLNRSVTVTA
jgi:hypothetical protein